MTDSIDKELDDFDEASARIKALEADWTSEVVETQRRRKLRYYDVFTDDLRDSGKIALDAFHNPRRIIDMNIRRELAPYIAYLTQSRDAAKFRPMTTGSPESEPLEAEFTSWVQYPKWQLPFFAWMDGMATHGSAHIRTLFDAEMPGHFRNDSVTHENLNYPLDVENIQEADLVTEDIYASRVQFLEYDQANEFDPKAVAEVLTYLRSREGNSFTKVKLKMVWFKDDDLKVKRAWWCNEATVWLKAPDFFYNGVSSATGPERETEYPYETLLYTIAEGCQLAYVKGRAFLDEPDQEACTSLVSSFLTRAHRSTYILTAPSNPTEDGEMKQTELSIRDGAVFTQPANFFSIDPPGTEILQGMQTLITQNASEVGQVNYAVNNRKDSRKTAKEIQSADQQSAMLNSVQVTLVSVALASLFKRCWRIAQSQVIRGKLASQLPNWENWYNRPWTLLPAGDVDVIKRQELNQARKQDWPVVSQTPAAQRFLGKILQSTYPPAEAAAYIQDIEMGNRKDNLLKGAQAAIQQLVQANPESAVQFGPQLQELATEYDQVMNPNPSNPQAQPTENAA